MAGGGLTTADMRDWLRSAIRGNPWTYHSAPGEMPIAPLISPLRFDVLVRASYFGFYKENRELFRSDPAGFAELARGHEYYVWFREIMCVHWQPTVLADPVILDVAWQRRLYASAMLYESFERNGFDSRFPITLYAGRRLNPTETGKQVVREAYAGDGNHRLALLLAAGRETLRPDEYRIKRYWRLTPGDTTPLLLDALDVDEERYFNFLRLGYPKLRLTGSDVELQVDGLSGRAESELHSVLKVDNRTRDRESH